MTNEELLDKIKAEIEKRIKECEATYPKDKDGYWFPEQEEAHAIAGEYKQLLSFLSTLEEQPKEVRNPIFDECVANVDPEVMEEVSRNIDIEDELVRYFGRMPEDDEDKIELARHFAQWGAEHTPLPEDTVLFNKGVAEGRRLERDEFEKNRLAACDNMSKEEYDRETDFVDSIIKKEHRQPTFSDAINYGMRLQKEQDEKEQADLFTIVALDAAQRAKKQMMDEWLKDRDGCFWDGVEEGKKAMREQMLKEAVEGEVCGRVYDHINVRFADGVCKFLEPKNISHIPADVSKYKVGDKVKILIVKE